MNRPKVKIVKDQLHDGSYFAYQANYTEVGKQMAENRYEPYETALMLANVHLNNIVVDVGANIGYYTIQLAKTVGEQGIVYAYEPDEINFQILKKNLNFNHVKCVLPFKVAISNKKGVAKLYRSTSNSGDHRLYKTKDEKRVEVLVNTNTLDNLLNIKLKIDLIKIDTQGYEPSVIDGAWQIISSNNPLIFLEFWPYGYDKSGLDGYQMLDKLSAIYFFSIIDEARKCTQLITIDEIKNMYRTRDPYDHLNLVCYPKNNSIKLLQPDISKIADDYQSLRLQTLQFRRFIMQTPARYVGHYANGQYEPFTTEIIAKLVSPRSHFVDVGSHIGYFSLVAATANKDIKITSIEPVKETIHLLSNNFKINNLPNPTIHNVIASNLTQKGKINIKEYSDTCSLYRDPQENVLESRILPQIKLDDILSHERVDLIKIDVEGHEENVLKGLINTIKTNKDVVLIVEYNPSVQAMAKKQTVQPIKLLQQMGFLTYAISEDDHQLKQIQTNIRNQTWLLEWVQKSRFGYVNVLALPKSKGRKIIATLQKRTPKMLSKTYKKGFGIGNKLKISYAQNGEDIVLSRVFNKNHGTYIDIGAASPNQLSVTKYFYLKGWTGINVEPVENFYHELVKERSRDININACIGNRVGSLDFYECPVQPEYSSASLELIREHLNFGYVFVKHNLLVYDLKTIFHDNHITNIDFLKIDVEGMETEVIQGNDWRKFRPVIVLIETSHGNDWEQLLFKQDYLLALDDGLNRYYVRKESQTLLNQMKVGANVMDGYITYDLLSSQQRISKLEFDLVQTQQRLNRINFDDIASINEELKNTKVLLDKIQSSKFYRIWRRYCQLKEKLIHPK